MRAVLTVELEEVAWRQRSRAVWLKEGDKNTKFSHETMNYHKRYNNIDSLLIKGAIVSEPTVEIIGLFQNLYRENEHWRPQFNPRDQVVLNEEDNLLVQGQFGEQEIKECVFACAGDKAPGPDGITMAFFIKCWEAVRMDVITAIQNFHYQGFFEKKSLNATFIALIPKRTGALELKDFTPISLVGSVYKNISKILIKLLKKVISKLVDKYLLAFIKGRQIMDIGCYSY